MVLSGDDLLTRPTPYCPSTRPAGWAEPGRSMVWEDSFDSFLLTPGQEGRGGIEISDEENLGSRRTNIIQL